MAIIRKKLETLKPGSQYIASVRLKNTDLNTYSEFSDSIRFIVPTDQTIPNQIQSLQILANFRSVMFVFTAAEDRDLAEYEYELYTEDDIKTEGNIQILPYEIIDGKSPFLTGKNRANVFSVAITEDEAATPNSFTFRNIDTGDSEIFNVAFYGRVRAVDTAGNVGLWTPIVKSGDTPLITEQYVSSLTASAITAGTISAAVIKLSGSNSIIQSSGYVQGSAGWKIDGAGNAEFDAAVIRGTVTVSGGIWIDSNNRWNRNSNNTNSDNVFRVGNSSSYVLWNGTAEALTINIGSGNSIFKADTNGIYLGNANFASAPFRVTTGGALTATSAAITGTITSSTITGGTITIGSGTSIFKADNNGIYLGNGTFSSAPFRVTAGGTLTANSATITGTINATSGTFSGNISSTATITGGTLRTAASGARIVLANSEMNLYAASSTSDTAEIVFNPPTNLYSGIIRSTGSLLLTGGGIDFKFGVYGPNTGSNFGSGTHNFNGTLRSPGTLEAGSSWTTSGSGRVRVGFGSGTAGITTNCSVDGAFHVAFYRGGVGSGAIVQNGASAVLYSPSDARLKTEIDTFIDPVETLLSLKPKWFNWRNSKVVDYGFYAQEAYEIWDGFAIPGTDELVIRNDSATPEYEQCYPEDLGLSCEEALADPKVGLSKPWMMDDSKMIPFLVATVQYLHDRIEDLESQLAN